MLASVWPQSALHSPQTDPQSSQTGSHSSQAGPHSPQTVPRLVSMGLPGLISIRMSWPGLAWVGLVKPRSEAQTCRVTPAKHP